MELFEARYGLQVDQYAFHTEDGGAGEFRGGRGVTLDYRILGEEVFLTYAASRTDSKPWSLAEGKEGSTNYALIIRSDGTEERHHMCTMVRAGKGDVIRVVSAAGGGFGNAANRPRARVEQDLKNGYITLAQARRDYGYSC